MSIVGTVNFVCHLRVTARVLTCFIDWRRLLNIVSERRGSFRVSHHITVVDCGRIQGACASHCRCAYNFYHALPMLVNATARFQGLSVHLHVYHVLSQSLNDANLYQEFFNISSMEVSVTRFCEGFQEIQKG